MNLNLNSSAHKMEKIDEQKSTESFKNITVKGTDKNHDLESVDSPKNETKEK